MKKIDFLKYAAFSLALGLTVAACDDDDEVANGGGEETTVDPSELSFIVSAGDPDNDLSGGIAMRIYSDLSDATRTSQEVYNDATSGNTLKIADCFTQVTFNSESQVFTGFVYARAAGAEEDGGLGSKQAGLRCYQIADGPVLEEISGSPVLLSNFGNTGSFGTYSYAAQISNPYAEVLSFSGNSSVTGELITLSLPTIAIDEVNPSVSNIVDMGNDKLAMVLNYSNRDSAVVAFTDHTLAVDASRVIYDSRIGASVGATRSVRYAQSGADDNGNVYVFSGNPTNDDRIGALRINSGTETFDSSYFFDIAAESDGYRFRKAFHISDDYFLLEFFIDKDNHGNTATSGRMAVVKMEDKSFTWVTGLPTDYENISIAWGDGYNGVYYLPISGATSMSGSGDGDGVTPTVYAINAATGVATTFMTFKTTELVKAFTIIKQ